MNDLRLPFSIRWAGEPMPDLAEFSAPLAIPFRLCSPGIPAQTEAHRADHNAPPPNT